MSERARSGYSQHPPLGEACARVLLASVGKTITAAEIATSTGYTRPQVMGAVNHMITKIRAGKLKPDYVITRVSHGVWRVLDTEEAAGRDPAGFIQTVTNANPEEAQAILSGIFEVVAELKDGRLLVRDGSGIYFRADIQEL